MKRLVSLCAGATLLFAASAMAQGGGATELKVGDPAPAFKLPGTDGKMHDLKDYRGTTVILAWFPKAFTGG